MQIQETIYIKDVSDNKLWSTTYHPTKSEPDEYEAIFSPHEAEFRRRDKGCKHLHNNKSCSK